MGVRAAAGGVVSVLIQALSRRTAAPAALQSLAQDSRSLPGCSKLSSTLGEHCPDVYEDHGNQAPTDAYSAAVCNHWNLNTSMLR